MRKTLGVAALMLALCCPALGGEMPTPPAPKSESVMDLEPTAGDEIPDDCVPYDAPYGLTLIALEALALLPSLL